MNFLMNRLRKKGTSLSLEQTESQTFSDDLPLTQNLQYNLSTLKHEFGNTKDLIIRQFNLPHSVPIQAAVVYIEGISDEAAIHRSVISPLMELWYENMLPDTSVSESLKMLKEYVITNGNVKSARNWHDVIFALLSGDTVLLIDNWADALISNTSGGEKRAIEEPTSQTVVRGPKDGFVENLGVNISLIRRRLKSINLRVQNMLIGEVTQTSVAVMYMDDIVNKQILQELNERLNRIDTDAILDSGYIQAFIEDQTFTIFPTIIDTERPDAVTSHLLEGRIAVLVDGTPFALIIPAPFTSFFQSPEDYYIRYDIATFLRFIRFFSFFLTLLAPSIYIALITFHQSMIPTKLLISLAAQREGVPFPAVVEAFLMEIAFEILREAGIRMPRVVGQAVSIVGAVILGQSAVQAGLASPVMVIVVAITAIAGFVMPNISISITARLLRFILMIIASLMGFYGIVLALIMITAHMVDLRSFGIPYLKPIAPFIADEQKDTVFRFPLWAMINRPKLVASKNRRRMKPDLQPSSEQNKSGRNKGDTGEE